jgi:hypothetical protein
MMAKVKPLSLENVTIGFRNFEGREGMYNKAGERSFAVFLPRDLADALAAEGWNVKFPKEDPRAVDPDAEGRDPYLQISVSFDNYPPNVFIISNGSPTRLDAEQVLMLDWAEIENVDLVIRPYEWSVNRNSGIKAYLKAGYFTIVTDAFAAKYGL